MDWAQVRQNIADFFHGMALAGYQKRLREQLMELNDLFMLHCFMELVGLPNPATIYLMEIYPYFLEEFHLWHRRMGMDHAPLGAQPYGRACAMFSGNEFSFAAEREELARRR